MPAVAPVTGMLRNKFLRDLTGALTLGGACATYWWYGIHLTPFEKREQLLAKLKAEKESQ